jgi:hypothetical protein
MRRPAGHGGVDEANTDHAGQHRVREVQQDHPTRPVPHRNEPGSALASHVYADRAGPSQGGQWATARRRKHTLRMYFLRHWLQSVRPAVEEAYPIRRNCGPLSRSTWATNRWRSRIRVRVEHPIGIIKRALASPRCATGDWRSAQALAPLAAGVVSSAFHHQELGGPTLHSEARHHPIQGARASAGPDDGSRHHLIQTFPREHWSQSTATVIAQTKNAT